METINPIDLFFSTQNINLLYEQIQLYLQTKHNTEIGREYLKELIDIMKMVIKPIKRISKNTDIKQFVITLNQQTISEAIPIFVNAHSKLSNNKLSNSKLLNNKLSDSKSNNKSNNKLINRSPNAQVTNLPTQIPKPSYNGTKHEDFKNDIEDKFNELRQKTSGGPKPKPIDFSKLNPNLNDPKFDDPKINAPVDQLFQQYANIRENDIRHLNPTNELHSNPLNSNPLNSNPLHLNQLNSTHPPTYETIDTFSSNEISQNEISQVPLFELPFHPKYHSDPHLDSHSNSHSDPNSDKKKKKKKEISVDSIYEEQDYLSNHPSNYQSNRTHQPLHQPSHQPLHHQPHPNINFIDVAASMTQHSIEPPQPVQLQTLIPKTSRNTVHESKLIPTIVTVDSRDKDPSVENDNSYRIAIDEIKDVVSIELTDAQIPISEYIINASNNLIYFEETNGITLIAELTVGNYDANDLATEIETQMSSVGASTYTVGVDTMQNRFIFNSDGAGGGGIFNLLFDGGTIPIGFEKEKTIYITRSVGEVIGFAPADLTGSLTYTGQYTFNLKGEKYILLHVKEAELLKTRDSNVKNAFAKIVLDKPLGETKFYSSNTDNQFIKYFSPPIGRLGYLTIEFRKQNGDLYDFNGQYNSLTFEIITKDITKSPY